MQDQADSDTAYLIEANRRIIEATLETLAIAKHESERLRVLMQESWELRGQMTQGEDRDPGETRRRDREA